ncbi:MAG: hypothetical protein R2862_06815 [Thermoanaerobaculia bacterium]
MPFSRMPRGQIGIDCRYCTRSRAGVGGDPADPDLHEPPWPAWTNAQLLEPIRASYRESKPIRWNRVNIADVCQPLDPSPKGVACHTLPRGPRRQDAAHAEVSR